MYKVGFRHFMEHYRLQIVMFEMIGSEVSASHQNLCSTLPICTTNKLGMKSAQRVDNPVVKLVFDDGLLFSWELILSIPLHIRDPFVVITFNAYKECINVCCSEILKDKFTYVHHSLSVQEGCSQVDFTFGV